MQGVAACGDFRRRGDAGSAGQRTSGGLEEGNAETELHEIKVMSGPQAIKNRRGPEAGYY